MVFGIDDAVLVGAGVAVAVLTGGGYVIYRVVHLKCYTEISVCSNTSPDTVFRAAVFLLSRVHGSPHDLDYYDMPVKRQADGTVLSKAVFIPAASKSWSTVLLTHTVVEDGRGLWDRIRGRPPCMRKRLHTTSVRVRWEEAPGEPSVPMKVVFRVWSLWGRSVEAVQTNISNAFKPTLGEACVAGLATLDEAE